MCLIYKSNSLLSLSSTNSINFSLSLNSHLDNRVFASLANGDIIIYRRDLSGGWNVADRQVVSISTAAAPVTKMMAVAGKLWCAAMNTVRVLGTISLQVEVREFPSI